ncbi:hypothetical protein TRFO_35636 [Tritrichomonas foetus]|uniref:Glycosyltransferase family 92 protein n=1 Tax=Tritrichomonas foetus TaxID=1144522 RepID=A0A1J4JFX8_9EUKA|nr:hypothetical protein TRFO_35636 [Tritrichomonas foetus]|eukprot:OHS98032.1 hypothetical protein TRFO_35636 [Tritrichomonas foetus]
MASDKSMEDNIHTSSNTYPFNSTSENVCINEKTQNASNSEPAHQTKYSKNRYDKNSHQKGISLPNLSINGVCSFRSGLLSFVILFFVFLIDSIQIFQFAIFNPPNPINLLTLITQQGNKFFICGSFKYEGPYLKEWVEYHLNLGIDKIVLYDNNKDDSDQPYIDEIRKMTNRVRFINKKNLPYNQNGWYTDFYQTLKPDQWAFFIDIDEFVTFSKNLTLEKYVQMADENKCDHIKINWIMYGNCGKLKKENGTQFERFPIPTQPLTFIKNGRMENSHVKTFAKGGKNGRFPSCHYISGNFTACNGNLQPCRNDTPWISPVWDLAYYRHYWSRSEEEYINKLKRRWTHGKMYNWASYNKVNKYPPNVPYNGTEF